MSLRVKVSTFKLRISTGILFTQWDCTYRSFLNFAKNVWPWCPQNHQALIDSLKPVFHGACFEAVSAPTLYAPYPRRVRRNRFKTRSMENGLYVAIIAYVMQSPTQVQSRYEIGQNNDDFYYGLGEIYSGPKYRSKPSPRHTLTVNTRRWAPSSIRARVSTEPIRSPLAGVPGAHM